MTRRDRIIGEATYRAQRTPLISLWHWISSCMKEKSLGNFKLGTHMKKLNVLERWEMVCRGNGENREIRDFCSQEMKQEQRGCKTSGWGLI